MRSHHLLSRNKICLWIFLTHYIVIWVNVFVVVGAVCPKLCHCKWRDGKETVACPNADFIDIPRGLDSTIQILDLRRNNLKILPHDAFLDTGLVNLQKVWLNNCKLKYIIDGAFRHLANLIELDLSENVLTTIPSKPLSDISGLRTLVISRNSITVVPKEAFMHVPLLVKLDLSHNNITIVHESAFAFLNRLEDLKLSFNKLKTLPVNVLQPLALLHGLHVDNNQWHCNCYLRLLRQWLLERNVAASIPPKCMSPERLKGRGWQTLDEDEFVCVPHVTAVAQRVIASHGDNVTLACKVETDVGASVTWLVGDKTLANTSTDEQRKYNVLELGAENSGTRVSNLTIEGAVTQDQGTYRCVVENKAGRVETNLTLKVSEEITEVRYIAKEEKVRSIPEWIYGAIAGLTGVIAMIIVIVTFRFRRKQKQKSTSKECDVELQSNESNVAEGSAESPSSKIQYISSVNSNTSRMTNSTTAVEVMPKMYNELQITCVDKQVLPNYSHDDNNKCPTQSISYVQIQNPYNIKKREVIDISQLEAMLGNQLHGIVSDNIFIESWKNFPDLLDISNCPTSTINTPNVIDPRYPNLIVGSSNTLCTATTRNTSDGYVNRYHQPSGSALPDGAHLAGTSSSVSQLPALYAQPSTSSSTKRHVHFQDEMEDVPESKRLLQYHATQLYKFLQEYKHLQQQLQTFKSEKNITPSGNKITDTTHHPATPSPSDHISDIQSSIEYLLAHQASIPPPIIDTVNQLSATQDTPPIHLDDRSCMDVPNILEQLPPPPNLPLELQCCETQPSLYIIPPPSSHVTHSIPMNFPIVVSTPPSSESIHTTSNPGGNKLLDDRILQQPP